jgi:hypothetical protein
MASLRGEVRTKISGIACAHPSGNDSSEHRERVVVVVATVEPLGE